MDEKYWAARGVDVTQASAARVYDYILGGDCNFEADRKLAAQLDTVMPDAPRVARANRAYIHRTISSLCARGVTQFLDIGSGIPSGKGSVHEQARRHAPGARVAYVEIDPVAVAHGRDLLARDPAATMILGDVRDPDAVLAHREVREVIDFGRPVGVLMLAVLHFVEADEKAAAVVARLAEATVPGSYFVIAHFVAGTGGGEGMANLAGSAAARLVARTPERLTRIMGGLELTEPGVVFPLHWRPASQDYGDPDPAKDDLMAGLWHRP
jgi:S-adenosyl methyltransferase